MYRCIQEIFVNVSEFLLGISKTVSSILGGDHSERGDFYQVIELVRAHKKIHQHIKNWDDEAICRK